MFQTWPNLFLQSFASDTLTRFMLRVSDMGYQPFLAGVVAVCLFGVSFRRGFLVLQLLLWSALINSVLKDAFALPRPMHVDVNVLNDGQRTTSPFASMGATSFFGTLPQAVVDHVRAVIPPGGDDYGFPSGHVQSTTVLWGGMSALWNNRILAWLAPVAVVLMAVSRMYLGRHFLADVLGGAALGVAIVLALVFAQREAWDRALFARASAALRAALPNAAVWLWLVGAPLAIVPFYPERGGAMMGAGAGFLLVLAGGLPDDGGTRAQRAERVGIALVIFAAVRGMLALAVGAAGLDGRVWWIAAASQFVPAFLMIWGTTAASTRAGLYRRP